MGVRETINSRDGHIYYVIETGAGKKVYVGVFFLEHYEDLSTVMGEPGLWFVRDAAADETGQNGDPTVHQGWAMYTWDEKKKNISAEGAVTWGGWRKVAEQESVDGVWGIDEIVRKSFVTKVEFTQYKESIEERLVVVEERSKENEQDIDNLIKAIDELNKYKHKHDNLDVLNALSSEGNNLAFEGKMAGGYYLYDNVVGGKLYWKDPTDSEAAAVEKVNSLAIAQAFAQTTLASAGMSLAVMEADGSFTKFALLRGTEDTDYRQLLYLSQVCSDRKYFDKDTEGNYTSITGEEATRILTAKESGHDLYYTDKVCVAEPESATHVNSYGGVIFVTTLPESGIRNDGRGVWYPTTDDGTYEPNKFYVSVNGVWTPVDALGGSGTEITVKGAAFTLSHSSDDPLVPFKRNYLFWSYPEDDADHSAWLGKTVLVRKFGSAPESITDGDQIATFNSRDITKWTDTCPFSTEQVYYRLFSKTRSGADYITADAVTPQNLTWNTIFSATSQGLLKKMFSVGDIIVLPKHPKFGMIECEVIALNEVAGDIKGKITIATKEALACMAFGDTNDYSSSALKSWLETNFTSYTKMVETEDGQAQDGKTYYVFGDTGYEALTITAGSDLPEGVVVYEVSSDFPNGLIASSGIPSASETIGYSNITKTKYVDHLKESTDWWTRDTSGSDLTTGKGETATPTDKLGVVVVFTVQEL